MSISNFLDKDVNIYRRNLGAVNDYGESKETWVKVTTVKGTIQPSSGNVSREENGVMITSTHRMYCLATVNIKADDKIELNGTWYNVLFVGDASGKGHHYEIDLKVNESNA